MELRHLRYFIAVAEEGHITRAAERLDMQQPPLSRLIKAIERELDVQLFRRKPRGVELTDAGRAFLDNARAILADLDHAFETARSTARGEQGRICVGVTPTGPFHPFVPRVIRAYRQAFSLVSVTLEEGFSNELIEYLRHEHIDTAFIRTRPADPEGLVISPLLEEPLVVALLSSFVEGPCRRNIHYPRQPAWVGVACRDGCGMPRRRLYPSRRPGSSSSRIDSQPRRCRARHFVRSGLPAANECGRSGISSPQGPRATEGPTAPRL